MQAEPETTSRFRAGLLRYRTFRQLVKFGLVGATGFVINVAVFAFCLRVLDVHYRLAYVIAFCVAVTNNFVWNRLWTFRHRRQANVLREFLMFILINGIGIGISTGFTALAKYGLGITDKNMLFFAGVAGILVATVVRFFAYRFLVFNQELDQEPEFSHDHEIIEAHPHREPARAAERPASTSADGGPQA